MASHLCSISINNPYLADRTLLHPTLNWSGPAGACQDLPCGELRLPLSCQPYLKDSSQTPVQGAVAFSSFVSQAGASWVLQCLVGSTKAFNCIVKAMVTCLSRGGGAKVLGCLGTDWRLQPLQLLQQLLQAAVLCDRISNLRVFRGVVLDTD